jgi:hypothetical protein
MRTGKLIVTTAPREYALTRQAKCDVDNILKGDRR